MDYASMVISLAALAIASAGFLRQKPEPRTASLRRVCRTAVDYAEKVGGTAQEKRAHAISAARALDMKDGKRDFSDVELRIGIEAALAE